VTARTPAEPRWRSRARLRSRRRLWGGSSHHVDRHSAAARCRSRTEAATLTVRPRNLVERLAPSAGYRFDRALALVHRRGCKRRRRSGRTLGTPRSSRHRARQPHERSVAEAIARREAAGGSKRSCDHGSRTLEIGRQQERRVARADDCFADRGREGYAGGRLLTAGLHIAGRMQQSCAPD
jgi:hypothetical protein